MFVQKFKFILMKMHKNCCQQRCSFWLRYTPNRLSAGAGAVPQTPLGELTALPRPPRWFRGWGPRERKEGGEGERREGRRWRGREGRESRNAQIQSSQTWPRKTKIGTVTRTPLSPSKGQWSTCRGWWHIVAASHTACFKRIMFGMSALFTAASTL